MAPSEHHQQNAQMGYNISNIVLAAASTIQAVFSIFVWFWDRASGRKQWNETKRETEEMKREIGEMRKRMNEKEEEVESKRMKMAKRLAEQRIRANELEERLRAAEVEISRLEGMIGNLAENQAEVARLNSELREQTEAAAFSRGLLVGLADSRERE